MITLTEVAANEVKRIYQDMDGERYLRITVKGGGCAGFKFSLELDEKTTDKDEMSEQHGVKVVVDQRSAMYLEGVKLDFHQDISKRGFVFDTPGNYGKCGCGMSFSQN